MTNTERNKALNAYCNANYGRPAAQMSTFQLWDLVSCIGPFVIGGPTKAKSPQARDIQNAALALIAKRTRRPV